MRSRSPDCGLTTAAEIDRLEEPDEIGLGTGAVL